MTAEAGRESNSRESAPARFAYLEFRFAGR
jgi:hypothetical protein